MAISRLSLAMVLHLDGDTVDFARIVPGAMLAVPHHLERVEEYLVGKELTAEVSANAVKLVKEVVIAETGMRPSFKYKLPVLEGLVRRLFNQFREGEVGHG
jgi:xanthine dehydrogenase iron-sulfur cluster and FAD-binding subunit A